MTKDHLHDRIKMVITRHDQRGLPPHMNHSPVKFRLITMPCCGQMFCWVNPRLPNYCPECGTSSYMKLKTQPEHILLTDDSAWLHYKGGEV